MLQLQDELLRTLLVILPLLHKFHELRCFLLVIVTRRLHRRRSLLLDEVVDQAQAVSTGDGLDFMPAVCMGVAMLLG